MGNNFFKEKKISILFIVIIILLIPIITSIQRNSEKQILKDNFSRMIELNSQKKMAVIDFSIIGTFRWDRLYIFEPYTPCEQIRIATQSFWLGCEFSTRIASSEDIVLFVFTKDNKIVQYFEHSRGPICDFANITNRKGYIREDAVFVVQENECAPLN